MKRPSLVAGGSLPQRLQAAEAAWNLKDFSTCLEILQSAHQLVPANTAVLVQLGRVHGLRYDYAAAERCFEQALKLAPQKTAMLTAIADSCDIFRNPELRERYLRQAVAQPDATPQLLVNLAGLYERLRRVPEAAQLVERALTLDPASPAARLVRARLERLAGRLEEAEQTLRSFLGRPIPELWTHVQAWYELGQNLDRQGRYDDAMQAFLNAKRLLLPQAAQQLAELKTFRARLRVMEANVSTQLFQRWLENACRACKIIVQTTECFVAG